MSTRSTLQSAPTAAAGSVSATLGSAGSSLELGRHRKQTSSSLSKQPRQQAGSRQLKLSSAGISSGLEEPSYPAVSTSAVELSADRPSVIKASSIVFARFRSDSFRVAKILNTDRIRGRCYMRFEDDQTHWCRFYELQQNIYAGEGCCLCGQRVDGVPEESEYINCTKCQMGFHRKCHNPPVSVDQTGKEDLDWLCRVCYYKKSGEKHDVFLKKRSSSASSSSTSLSDVSSNEIGSLGKVHKVNKANRSPRNKSKTIGKQLIQNNTAQSKSVSDGCTDSQGLKQSHKTGNSKGKISRLEVKFKKRKKDSNETTDDRIVVGASDNEHRNSIGSTETSSPALLIISSNGDRTFPTLHEQASKPRNRYSNGAASIDEIISEVQNGGKQKSADNASCDTDISLSKSSSLESLVCLDDVISDRLNSNGRIQSVPRQSYVTELSSSEEFSDLESEGSDSEPEMDFLKEKFLNRAESAGSTPCRPTSDQGTMSTARPLSNALRTADSELVYSSMQRYPTTSTSAVEPCTDAEAYVVNSNIAEQVQASSDLRSTCSVNTVRGCARKRGRPPQAARPDSWHRKGSGQGRLPSKKSKDLLTKDAGNLKAVVSSSGGFTNKANKRSSIKLLENGEGSRRILRSVGNPFDHTTEGESVEFNGSDGVVHVDVSSVCGSKSTAQAESRRQCDGSLEVVANNEERALPRLLKLHEEDSQQSSQEQRGKKRQQCEESSGITISDSPISVSRPHDQSLLDHCGDQILEDTVDSLPHLLPQLVPIVSAKPSHKKLFRGPYKKKKKLQRPGGGDMNSISAAAANRSIPLGSKFCSKGRILGKNPRGRPKLKNDLVRQSEGQLLNDRSGDRKVSAVDIIASLTHPRNAVDKSVIETACKENTDKERLAAAMVDYFGTKSRLLDGAACRIVGLRVGETGALEYLVEWENGVVV